MATRDEITRVTKDANGNRLLNQVDPVTGVDVDQPPKGSASQNGVRPNWQNGYTFSNGFTVN